MRTICRIAALLVVACVGGSLTGTAPADGAPAPSAPGYWLGGADGGVFSLGAHFYGSGIAPPGPCLYAPQPGSLQDSTSGCAGIAGTPNGNGYWLLNSFRSAVAFG